MTGGAVGCLEHPFARGKPETLTPLRNELLLHADRCYEEFIERRHGELDRAERSFMTRWGLEYLAGPIRGDDGG